MSRKRKARTKKKVNYTTIRFSFAMHIDLFSPLMKTLFFLIAVVLSTSAFSIVNFNANEDLHVLAFSGINLRNAPNGGLVHHIPFGTTIRTMEAKTDRNTETIEGIRGSWVRVIYDGHEGMVFDGFLSRLPAPLKEDVSLEQYSQHSFKALTPKILVDYYAATDDAESSTYSQAFMYNGDNAMFTSSEYYEGGYEYLSLAGISMEEVYLLARIIFREKIAHAISLFEQEPNFDITPYKEFVLNSNVSIAVADGEEPIEQPVYYECQLADGCEYAIRIVSHEGRVILSVGGGC
jgi:hypothetical protein